MLYRTLLRPALFRLPAETAHETALRALSIGLGTNFARHLAARRYQRSPFGDLKRFGLTFSNPVGLAAGFDKDGVVAGFNNSGAAALAARLRQQQQQHPSGVLGINIGKSRAVRVEAAVDDYLQSFEKIYEVADYVAVNVSSPNTPNLRQLQQARQLEDLLAALQQRNCEMAAARARAAPLPILLKIAPDLSATELESIVEVIVRTHISGIIATNTTISRNNLRTPVNEVEKFGEGGLSGAPLRERSTEIISALYRLTDGRIPIIGVGGIFSAADAWEKICAGASLIQVYTGFVYQGLRVARDINDGLLRIMTEQGFQSFDQAVGSRTRSSGCAQAAVASSSC